MSPGEGAPGHGVSLSCSVLRGKNFTMAGEGQSFPNSEVHFKTGTRYYTTFVQTLSTLLWIQPLYLLLRYPWGLVSRWCPVHTEFSSELLSKQQRWPSILALSPVYTSLPLGKASLQVRSSWFKHHTDSDPSPQSVPVVSSHDFHLVTSPLSNPNYVTFIW